MNLRKVNIVNVKASDGTFELWLCVCTYNNNTIRMCIHFEAMLMSKVHKQINNKTTELARFFFQFLSKNIALLFKAFVEITIKLMKNGTMNRIVQYTQ